jgi:hypothetical protein
LNFIGDGLPFVFGCGSPAFGKNKRILQLISSHRILQTCITDFTFIYSPCDKNKSPFHFAVKCEMTVRFPHGSERLLGHVIYIVGDPLQLQQQ